MTLDEKLAKKRYAEIWKEYCGFLNLDLSQYMDIQKRLLLEQLTLYNNCKLGEHIMGGRKPQTVEEFRAQAPLTTYDDYADILLQRADSYLPMKPAIWVETTWEGGKRPIKVAPYTDSMVRNHRANVLACMILSTSTQKGKFSLRTHDRFLNTMASLPYLSGLIPYVLQSEINVEFLPSIKEGSKMSFSQRTKKGFAMAMEGGVDIFFGLSSVIARMSESFLERGSSSGESGFSLRRCSPRMICRLLKALYRSKNTGKPVYPKDIWDVKGIMCCGTDTQSYKKRIEELWGVKPIEVFAGTEVTGLGVETWSKNGLVFFPDACFYEFIPLHEMEKNIEDPSYLPRTYLMDELVEGGTYELVISTFKGGAFMRYRVGDLFQCISLENPADDLKLPQFCYVDRVPTVIDIAGFTRISQRTIDTAIEISHLDIQNYFAVKKFDQENRSYMHLFVEASPEAMQQGAFTKDIIKEHLGIYFRYVDSDYKDLKKMLKVDPLQVSIIPQGTIETFEARYGRRVRRMNPSPYDVTEILKIAGQGRGVV